MTSWFDLGYCFLFFGRHFHLLAISFFIIFIDFFFVLGLLPVGFLILNGCLKINVDLRLFDFGLSLNDEQGQFIV